MSTQKKRFNVEFSGKALLILQELAAKRNKSISTIIRDAIAIQGFIEEAQEEGKKLMLEKDGKYTELWIK